jgi:hypothetical protein
MGFGRAHPCFFDCLVSRERGEALPSIIIMGHVLWSIVKSEADNDRAADFLRYSIGGSSLFGDDVLAS